MSANKAIRWGNLPSGGFMCVLCTSECWEVLGLHPFPARWLLMGAGISLCQKLVCFRVYIYPHLCPLPPCVWLQSLFPALLPPFSWSLCNLNCTYSSLIAQTYPGVLGWVVLSAWANQQTPGILQGYHYYSTGLYTPCLDQNKARYFRWLNKGGSALQTPAALSHSPRCASVRESVWRCKGGFPVQRSLVCSLWSAVWGESEWLQGAAKPKALNLMWSPVWVHMSVQRVFSSKGHSCLPPPKDNVTSTAVIWKSKNRFQGSFIFLPVK